MPGCRHTNTAVRPALWLPFAVITLVAGCQLAPRPPRCGDECPGGSHRGVAVTQEVASDTTAQLAHHPLATSAETVTWAGGCARRALADVGYKRLLLPVSHALPARPVPPSAPDPSLRPACIAVDIDGAAAFTRLEALIEGARQRLDVMMYLWEPDAVGWSLARRLARKAAELAAEGQGSPTVRVLVDRGGNLIHPPASLSTTADVNAAVCWLARQPHVEVLRTRPSLTRFDHRKLVIVDDHVAWSGGRNFTLLSFFNWHDLSFTLTGPLVEDLRQAFDRSWRAAGGPPSPRPPCEPCVADQSSNAQAKVVGTGPWRCDLARELYDAIDHAQHYIYLENPFFSDSVLLWKLSRARQRGVDVRVVVAQHGDSIVHEHATPVMINRMLRAGFRVYQYPGMTHVKAAAVDGTWLYLGTANFDGLSLSHNYELGLIIGAGPVIAEVEDHLFRTDLRPEWEVKKPVPVTPLDRAFDLLAGLVL